MKRKARFRTATRTDNGHAAKLREGWEIMTGLPVNEYRWYAYRDRYGTWYLIEGRTGLSVGYGPTIKSACWCLTSNETRMMNWCALAAKQPAIGTLPLWEDTATEAEQQWES